MSKTPTSVPESPIVPKTAVAAPVAVLQGETVAERQASLRGGRSGCLHRHRFSFAGANVRCNDVDRSDLMGSS